MDGYQVNDPQPLIQQTVFKGPRTQKYQPFD